MFNKNTFRNKYKAAIKPLIKPFKDWIFWIAAWEKAIS